VGALIKNILIHHGEPLKFPLPQNSGLKLSPRHCCAQDQLQSRFSAGLGSEEPTSLLVGCRGQGIGPQEVGLSMK
jgi:hypothetical protein